MACCQLSAKPLFVPVNGSDGLLLTEPRGTHFREIFIEENTLKNAEYKMAAGSHFVLALVHHNQAGTQEWDQISIIYSNFVGNSWYILFTYQSNP